MAADGFGKVSAKSLRLTTGHAGHGARGGRPRLVLGRNRHAWVALDLAPRGKLYPASHGARAAHRRSRGAKRVEPQGPAAVRVARHPSPVRTHTIRLPTLSG